MKDFILVTMLLFSLLGVLWLIVAVGTSHPDVHKSWSSGQCVKVEYSTAHNCDNLPKKYNTVWVQ